MALRMIAAGGGRVVKAVNTRTDRLAVADNRPLDEAQARRALDRRAVSMVASGHPSRIVAARERAALIAEGIA